MLGEILRLYYISGQPIGGKQACRHVVVLTEAIASISKPDVILTKFGILEREQGLTAAEEVLVSVKLPSEREAQAIETEEGLTIADGIPVLVRMEDTGSLAGRDDGTRFPTGQRGNTEESYLEGLATLRLETMTEAKGFEYKVGTSVVPICYSREANA